MATVKLTESWIASVKAPASGQADFFDVDPKGFGVRVSASGRKTFFVMTRVAGAKKRITIGTHGEMRPDPPTDPRTGNPSPEPWQVKNAREKARSMLGKVATAAATGAPAPTFTLKGNGLTWRDAIETHQTKMRAKNRSSRSIANVAYYLETYMPEWIDRQVSELDGPTVCAIHARIKQNARETVGIANEKGASTANKVIVTLSACWNSLNQKHLGKLGTWNPAKAVTLDTLKRSKKRLQEQELPEWFATVKTIAPVRRDLALFCLFSAMRTRAAREIRWEHIDWKAATFVIPTPKGGAEKAFTLPIGPTMMEILKRRRDENPFMMLHHGGDYGWVFPTVRRNARPDGTYEVIPVAEPKEQRIGPDGKKRSILASPHTLRRTYLSIGQEIKLSELDSSVLANHSFGSHNVNRAYIAQGLEHLARVQRAMDTALRVRLGIAGKRDLLGSDVSEPIRTGAKKPVALAAPHRARKVA